MGLFQPDLDFFAIKYRQITHATFEAFVTFTFALYHAVDPFTGRCLTCYLFHTYHF